MTCASFCQNVIDPQSDPNFKFQKEEILSVRIFKNKKCSNNCFKCPLKPQPQPVCDGDSSAWKNNTEVRAGYQYQYRFLIQIPVPIYLVKNQFA